MADFVVAGLSCYHHSVFTIYKGGKINFVPINTNRDMSGGWEAVSSTEPTPLKSCVAFTCKATSPTPPTPRCQDKGTWELQRKRFLGFPQQHRFHHGSS